MDANIYLKDGAGNPIGTAANPLVVYPATGTFDIVSPLTTKGDLLTYTTTNTRLAVATDNYILVPASAEAEGLKWVQLSDINGVACSGTSTDNAIARFHSTTGKIVQWSGVSIDDNGAISTPEGYGLGIGVAPSYLLHIKGTSTTDLPTYSDEFLDADNWTSAGWTGSWEAGWTHTSGNTTALSHDHAAVNGVQYEIEITISGGTTNGTFTITFGGVTSESITGSTGVKSFGPTAVSTGTLSITPSSTFDRTMVISIKSIIGVSTPQIVLTNSNGNTITEIRGSYSTNTNTFFGNTAGQYNTTGYYNSAYGQGALAKNTTGYQNTAIGLNTLGNNTTGINNTAIGQNVLQYNISGQRNSGVGFQALFSNTSGYRNAAFGYMAGYHITTGDTNTFIGYLSGYDANQKVDATNSTGLGSNTFTTRSNQVVIGDENVVETQLRTGVYIGSTSTTAHTQPTARLHIAAGSASAGTAPIKLTPGSLMTATEDGTFEYDGTNLYFSIGATRMTVTVT